ncbi:hypothetical protein HDU77_011335 [Chytriomyces hyalinus]|nr:hypothetical protein HDU77_011335 [Chytriomyces hyalinus]
MNQDMMDSLDASATTELKLQLPSGCLSIPPSIMRLHLLVRLDFSGNSALNCIPQSINSLVHLRSAFFSDCSFKVFPIELAACPALEMVAFKNNSMTDIPEHALPKELRWLILTNNKLTSLPHCIGYCHRLEKVMLAGNLLDSLPAEMEKCQLLTLIRISANKFQQIPEWLLKLPRIAFIAFAGNPLTSAYNTSTVSRDLTPIEWKDLAILNRLGEGASGVISRATWLKGPHEPQNTEPKTMEVAVKLFKGDLTSDGLPANEMEACIAAGVHPNLVTPFARITGHPLETQGLVFDLIPQDYKNLGKPPSLETCTRDVYPSDMSLSVKQVVRILQNIANAATVLHKRGISHGDLYAHNILYDASGTWPHRTALLGDFGAAFVYGSENPSAFLWERVEMLAFAFLVDDLLGIAERGTVEEMQVVETLERLSKSCSVPVVQDRPSFSDVEKTLDQIQLH